MYTPLERAVDRRNGLVRAAMQMREMAVHLIATRNDDPAAMVTEMQGWATRIDRVGEDAIEAAGRQPAAFEAATRDAQTRLAAEYQRRLQA